MFKVTDSNGRQIDDLGAHIMKAAHQEMEKMLVAKTKELTANLRCPTHNQGITSISVNPQGQNFTAKFDCCCPELQKLAQEAFAAA